MTQKSMTRISLPLGGRITLRMHDVVDPKPVIIDVPGDSDLVVEQTVTNRSENVKAASPVKAAEVPKR